MIPQALHADKRLKELGKQGRIIIKTSDTDVIVLCIYFYKQMKTPVNCRFKWETLLALRTVVGVYLFMNYVLLSQKLHVEFFLPHMLSLGVTLSLPSLELTKSQCVQNTESTRFPRFRQFGRSRQRCCYFMLFTVCS